MMVVRVVMGCPLGFVKGVRVKEGDRERGREMVVVWGGERAGLRVLGDERAVGLTEGLREGLRERLKDGSMAVLRVG